MQIRMSQAASRAFVVLASCGLCLTLSAQTAPSAQSASAAQSADDAEFQAAMAAQDRGDLQQARSILLELRRLHPGNFAVDESLGLVYVAQHNVSEALPFLVAATREQPASDAAQANLGAALYRLHRNSEALAAFRRAAQLNPTNAETQRSLGELLLDAGQPRKAADALAQAVHRRNDDPNLILEYASALVAAGDLDNAEHVVTAVPGSDTSAQAHALLGEIDERRADYRGAANHFSRAVAIDPSEPNAWALGVEFLRHWTFDAAIQEFQAGTQKFPDSTRMKLGLATAYFGAGKYGEAIPVFAALLKYDKNNHLYAEMLGMACTSVSSASKHDCSGLIEYAQAHPDDARAATDAATLLLTENAAPGQIATGRKLLAQAIRTAPRQPEAQYLMGLLRQQDGDWSGSIVNLQAALAADPQLAKAHYRLALAYWRTGNKKQAQLEADLQKKYAQAQQQDLDRRLREITTFVVDVRN